MHMPNTSTFIGEHAFRDHQHPLQKKRYYLALFFALLLFPLIAVGLVLGLLVLVVPLVAFGLWVSARTLYANLLGNTVQVSALNYPRIYDIGEELKTRLGYAKPVSIFVLEEASFNAY